MNKTKTILLSFVATLTLFTMFALPVSAIAYSHSETSGAGMARASKTDVLSADPKIYNVAATSVLDDPTTKAGQIMKVLKLGLNILSGAVGLAAVIMLIAGGIQYSASNGDPSGVKAAKDKITNVLIGLAAYVFLYAFLQWLIPGGILQ